MRDNPVVYFKKVKVINFEIINHEFRGDKSQGTYKKCKTIESGHLKNYPKEKTKTVMSAAFRNKRDDLWVQHDLISKHFRENFK